MDAPADVTGSGAHRLAICQRQRPDLRIFRRRLGRQSLLDVDRKAEGFKIGLEVMLGRHRDLRITEVPISFRDRTRGQSKMSLGQVSAYLRRLAALLGGLVSTSTVTQFALVGILGMVVDLGGFQLLRHAGL